LGKFLSRTFNLFCTLKLDKKRLACLVLFALTQPFLASCVAYSNPKVDSTTNIRVEKGRLSLSDVELWFLSWNRRGWGMVFPIPIPFDVSDDAKPPFHVTIGLTPDRAGFSFDPRKMFLWEVSDKKIAPSHIARGHHIKSQVVIGTIPRSPVTAITLQENVSTILTLEFDVSPPDPSQTFYVEIEGLLLNGKPYPVPRIRFEQDAGIWPVK